MVGAASFDPAATLDPRFKPCPPDPTLSRGPGLPGFWARGISATERAGAAPGGRPTKVERFAAHTSAGDALLALVGPHVGQYETYRDDVSDLPQFELPAARSSDTLAIVMSGDGGWRDLDNSIAKSLQRENPKSAHTTY